MSASWQIFIPAHLRGLNMLTHTPGDLKLWRLACRYNTYTFDGQKKVVLSTASWSGGANPFIGLAFLVVGGGSVTFGLSFALLAMCSQYKMGDSSRLSWNKNK